MNEVLLTKRKRKELTQQEIAKLLGVTRQYYNDIENDKRQPSVSLAQKLGKELDLDWTIFFTN